MSLLETLKNLFDKDREHLYAGWIEQSRVDRQLDGQPLAAGRHYVRLWLAEMFLKKEVKWMKSWHPAVHSLAGFDFGDQFVEIPNIADSRRVAMQSNSRGDVIARNFLLTPTMPFNGGIITLQAGLIALEGTNYLKSFLDVLGKFSVLLNVAQLSTVLNVAQPLALGVQELLGSSDGHLHLGFRNSYKAGELRNGYVVAVRATEEDVQPASLKVLDGQLRRDDATGRPRPLEEFDYMLFRIEVFEERDDWEKLTSIQEPLHEAIKALQDPLTEERAVFHLRTAMLRAHQSPELTKADRRRVVQALQEQFETARRDYGIAGLTGGRQVTLAQALRGATDAAAALEQGEPSEREIFALTEHASHAKSIMPPVATAAGEDGGAEDERGFNFALEGEGARGNAVKCGAEVALVFDYRVPPVDSLAIFTSAEELEEARQKNTDVRVSIIPRGFTVTDGKWSQTAKFEKDALVAPVRFQLKASEEPDEKAGFQIFFDCSGALLYEFYLPAPVVVAFAETGDSPPPPPPSIDLDEMMLARGGEQRSVRLFIFAKGERLSVLYDDEEGGESFSEELDDLTRTTLAAALNNIRPDLEGVANNQVWTMLQDPFNPPADEGIQKALEKCLRQVVGAGSTLYSALSADQKFAGILNRIEQLPVSSRLSIRTDCAYIPWEILYPERFQADWGDDVPAPRVEQLWGNRLLIECLQSKRGQDYKTPIKQHRSSPTFISFNLNSTIDEAFGASSYKPVKSHVEFAGQFADQAIKFEVKTTGEEIKKMLLAGDCEATLIYLYCHGQNDNPLQENQSERLEIDRDDFIRPRFLDNGQTYRRGPIIFLNSCSSGAFSPLSFSTFLTRFREKQSLGLITTSFTVPATFAAAFGQQFLTRYLAGERVGQVLRDMRRELLQQKIPLGLFYSLQCPADTTKQKEAA